MTEARANLSEMVAQARYLKRPVILTSRGKDVAMITSMDYLDEVMRKFLEG